MVGDPYKGYKQCKDKECPPDTKVTANLECEKCPKKMMQNKLKKHLCIHPKCPNEREFITDKGTCEACPDFNMPTRDKLDCERPLCLERQYIGTNGKCYVCPDQHYPSDDKKSCVKRSCPDAQPVAANGTCFYCPKG